MEKDKNYQKNKDYLERELREIEEKQAIYLTEEELDKRLEETIKRHINQG